MTKRVLITGASGFIGRFCLPLLKKRGFEIHAITSKQPSGFYDGIHWTQHDLLHTHSMKELVAAILPTHLLHLAWNVTPGKFWSTRENLDWLKVSIDLLEAFALHGGKRVVMAGTCAEYDWNASEFSESTTPCHPHSLYGSCKLALHLILESLSKQMGFSQAWGRIFFLYGPHEYPQRFIPSIIRGLLNKEETPCSHGNQIRDFLHVEDVADAFTALLDSEVQGAVNIGSGQGVSLRQVVEKISSELEGRELIQFGKRPPPQNEPAFLVPNTDKLNKELLWEPKINLEQGLRKTIAWWQEAQASLLI